MAVIQKGVVIESKSPAKKPILPSHRQDLQSESLQKQIGAELLSKSGEKVQKTKMQETDMKGSEEEKETNKKPKLEGEQDNGNFLKFKNINFLFTNFQLSKRKKTMM